MSTRTLRSSLAALTAAVLTVAATASVAHAADPSEPIRLESGHVDAFHLALNGDGITLNLQEDSTGHHVQRTPESVVLVVKDAALVTDAPATHLPPGAPTTMYLLPMLQNPDLLWPGWDSQGVASRFGSDADVDIAISKVDGPGSINLWTAGSFGDVRPLLTDGYTLPGTIHQSFLGHTHAFWGFTEAGTYTFTAQATVTSQDGARTAKSNAARYTFVVGSGGGSPAQGTTTTTTLTINNVPAHYHTGEVSTLTATPTPAGAAGTYRWFTRTTADDQWVAVEGATTATYGFVITRQHQVKAALYDGGRLVAETAPVDVVIDDHGSTPTVGPEVHADLPATEGALVVSVAPEAQVIEFTDLTLNPAADRYVSTGTMTGVTVTDTRRGGLGWSATGRVRGLITVNGGHIDGRYVGWTPTVDSASSGLAVTPGAAVAPGSMAAGGGIKGWSPLGSAAQGASVGTAVLGAGLRIEASVNSEPGSYRGVVLLTIV